MHFKVTLRDRRIEALSPRAKDYMRSKTYPNEKTEMVAQSLLVCLSELLSDGFKAVDGTGKRVTLDRLIRSPWIR